MSITNSLRKITEFGIGFGSVAMLTLAGCGGGGGGSGGSAAGVMVSTFAGTAGAHGIVDATGAAARFQIPTYIATDGTNLYVTDLYANNIRKIVIATGQVTTFAGSPTGASGVADAPSGPGTSALFNSPYGITIDASNSNLYVADTNSHTIRKIVIATGAVTTLAGAAGASGVADASSGTAARFNYPIGLARIGSNLFVADSSNNTIRKIDLVASAAVSTLAGSAVTAGGYVNSTSGASAVFNSPAGLISDGASYVYVADTLNNDVRRVDAATGATTLLAGGNSTLANSGVGTTDAIGMNARFNNPFGIATDGTNLYVADTYNHTIRKIVIATGFVSTPAGIAGSCGWTDGAGTSARFCYPMGLIYLNGVLYVADYTNGTIRKVQL